MNEGAQRQYDYITNGLKAESPEGIFTRHQIDQASVSMWGNALTSYHHQAEAELERVEATISDPDERERAIESINEYYAAKEVTFNRDNDVAVAELYRENGIPVEEKPLPEQTVDVYQNAAREQEQQKAEAQQKTYAEILQDKAQKPELTGRFGDDKGRREQTFAEYLAAKKEKEEKEPDKYTPEHQPTKKQIHDLSPGM